MQQVTFVKRLAKSGDKLLVIIPKDLNNRLDQDVPYQITMIPVDTVCVVRKNYFVENMI